MKNLDIRKAAMDADIHLYQIADKYGISEFYFSRKLRHELSPEAKDRIFAIIREISEAHNGNEV